jgi:hypothetical protein
MGKTPNLAAHVAKAVASAPTGKIADALGALVLMRCGGRHKDDPADA